MQDAMLAEKQLSFSLVVFSSRSVVGGASNTMLEECTPQLRTARLVSSASVNARRDARLSHWAQRSRVLKWYSHR